MNLQRMHILDSTFWTTADVDDVYDEVWWNSCSAGMPTCRRGCSPKSTAIFTCVAVRPRRFVSSHRSIAQDAAQALLSGLTVASSSNNTNGNHHQHHNGFMGKRDVHQNGGSGGGGGGGGGPDEPSTPSSNRKGHDEEQTLMGGVGNLVKRARRGVNSYFSALARQQKELARQQRERARKKSSTFDFLVDAEEGVGLLAIAGGGDAAGAGGVGGRAEATDGAPLHRSKSAVFVPPRQAQQLETPISTTALETRSTGVVEDAVELQDVGETDAFLQSGDMSYGLEEGGGKGSVGASGRGVAMTRGGRAGMTTGDLVRLYREEEQGAGEDSAQDEDRERPGALKKVGLNVSCVSDRSF